MKVAIGSVEVTDRFRKALRIHHGRSGLATREDVRLWAGTLIDSVSRYIISDLEEAERRAAPQDQPDEGGEDAEGRPD